MKNKETIGAMIICILAFVGGYAGSSFSHENSQLDTIVTKNGFFQNLGEIYFHNILLAVFILVLGVFFYLGATFIVSLNFFIFGSSFYLTVENYGSRALLLYSHGIIEIPAIIYSLSLSFLISTMFIKKLNDSNYNLFKSILNLKKSLGIVFLLFALSAAIESWIFNFIL